MSKLRNFSLAFIFYLLSVTPVIAQKEFDSRFNSTYSISEQGVTTVTHQIELTNKLSKVYAKQYSITSGSTRIKQVSATSATGSITTKTNRQNNQTSIDLTFDNPVVGKNKTQRFTLSYINLDTATKNGRVMEVNIPRLANINELDHYNLTIKVPNSFDKPTVITPPTQNTFQNNDFHQITFTKNQITSKGVSILFGDHQIYDFSLRYTLKNPGVTAATAKIAIPPDTIFQQLNYQTMDPKPLNITVDSDNNWLAEYRLKPMQTMMINFTGQATLYLKPTIPITQPIDLQSLLKPQNFWQTQNQQIINTAKDLKSAENIYNYIVQNLTYNYDRIDATSTTRLGSLSALNNPQNSICTEFTDLFVALARAAGIPARSHDGYAFTANSKLRPLSLKLDVLHTWPEYYNQDLKQWVQVDPTWGNTTQGIDYFSRWDLNHFTFAIHGADSVKPYPAGAYKLDTTSGKDVNISFSQTTAPIINKLSVDFIPPKINLPQLSQNISINITNQGSIALHNLNPQVSSPGYNIIRQPDKINTLPPNATKKVSIKIKPKSFIKPKSKIKLTINNQEFIYENTNSQTNSATIIGYIKTISLAAIIFIFFYITRRILVQKFSKRNSLHRKSKKSKK